MRSARLLLLILGLWGVSGPLAAQSTPLDLLSIPADSDVSAEEGSGRTATPEQLLRLLDDEQRLAELRATLRALIAAAEATPTEGPEDTPESPDPVAAPEALLHTFDAWLTRLGAVTVDFPSVAVWFFDQVDNPYHRRYWLRLGLVQLLVLGTAAASFWLVHRAGRAVRRERRARAPGTLAGKWRGAAGLLALRLVPIAAGLFAGTVMLALIVPERLPTNAGVDRPEDVFANLARALLQGIAAGLAALAVARTALAPDAPGLRLIKLSGTDGWAAYRWLWRFVVVAVPAVVLSNHLGDLRVPVALSAGLVRAGALIIAAMAAMVLLRFREPVARWIRGTEPETPALGASVRQFLADNWLWLGLAYIGATYLIWALDVPGGLNVLVRGALLTAIFVVLARPLARALRRMVDPDISLAHSVALGSPAAARRVERYRLAVHRLTTGAVYLLTGFAILLAWGVRPVQVLSDWLGPEGMGRVGNIVLLVIVGVLLWEGLSLALDIYLDRNDEAGTKVERSGRQRTLLPVLRTLMVGLVGTVLLMVTLADLGVDIGPLLAAAGVIGIAVGFGSQKLVQDMINGIFVLTEDTISIGDVIEVAGHAGEVEHISIRTVVLRDLEGAVHTISFSDITTVRNLTKDYSFALLRVGVGYSEDPQTVMEVLRQVGAELEADPDVGQFILEPIEIFGLDEMADSALILLARIKTKALKQWYVRREFNLRLMKRFERLGIEVPFPHRTVYLRHDAPMPAPQAPPGLRDLALERGGQRATAHDEPPGDGESAP